MRIEGSSGLPNFFGSQTYTTKTGDTLSSVAQMFQVSLQSLADANRLAQDSQLSPGLELLIPFQAASPLQQAGGIDNLFGADQIMPGIQTTAIGTTSQALTGVSNPIPFPEHLEQTEPRACGTTCLSMILKYYGVNLTPDQIDAVIRRTNVGVAPERVVDFARDQGLNAEQYNNGTWDELKSFIDKGIPCMVQIDPDSPDNFNTHYVDVVGYKTDPATGKEIVLIQDPSQSTGPTEMPIDEFMQKWGNLNIENVENGYNNFFIAIAPKGTDLPASRVDGNGAANALDTAKTDITNGFDRIVSPDKWTDVPRGIFELVGGVVGIIGGGVGFGIWKLGDWMHDGVEGIPVLENIVQPLGDIIAGFGEAFAGIFNTVDNVVKNVGDAFGCLFEGDFSGALENAGEAITDAVGGVVEAVGDVASGVVDAVGDFFSGW